MKQEKNPAAIKCELCAHAFALSTSRELVKCLALGKLTDTTNACPHYEEKKAVPK